MSSTNPISNKFLIEENTNLKYRIEELEEVIKYNKLALKVSLNDNSKNSVDSQSSTKSQDVIHLSQYKAVNNINKMLYEENQLLLEKINKLTKEKDISDGKALVFEQMYEQLKLQEKDNNEQQEEEIINLQKQIKENEKLIQQYEKTSQQYDELSGTVIKYKEIISYNEQTNKLYDENDKLNLIILKLVRDNTNIRCKNEQLVQMNIQLTQDLVKQQTAEKLPYFKNNYIQVRDNQGQQQQKQEFLGKQQIQSIDDYELTVDQNGEHQFVNEPEQEQERENKRETDLDKSAKIIYQFQKKFLDNSNENIKDQIPSPIMSPLPDKVVKLPNQQEEAKEKIPKLDLAKARKIQQLNAKRSTLQQEEKELQNNIQLVYDKNKQLEEQLDQVRKSLAREMIATKTLSMENEQLLKDNKQYEEINLTLINSNKRYEERWNQLFHSYQFYKQFYDRNHLNQHQQNNNALTTKKNENDQVLITEICEPNYNYQDLQYSIRQFKKVDKTGKKSLFDKITEQICQEDQQIIEQSKQNSKFQIDIESAKKYLLSLAANLQNQFLQSADNHKIPQNTHNKGHFKLQRSISNPIDYIDNSKMPFQDNMIILSQNQHDNANNQPQSSQKIAENNDKDEIQQNQATFEVFE